MSNKFENSTLAPVKPVKKKYGQYFTPSIVADFMITLADIGPYSKILEPSSGKGVFLDLLLRKGYKNLTAYELDAGLIAEHHKNIVRNESFVSANIREKFDLIIGNPPYIRWKNLENELKNELNSNPLWNQYFNSLCDYSYIFILKSIELLNENGQLIFITPEYWLNTTHSRSLRNYMARNGYFEEIYHFNETPIFDNVSVSFIIFKYIKSRNKKSDIQLVKYYSKKKLTASILQDLKERKNIEHARFFKIPQFSENESWLLIPDDIQKQLIHFEQKCKVGATTKPSLFPTETDYVTIGDVCDIGNGLVSGLDKAFQLNGEPLNRNEEQKRLKVVKARDLRPYFYEKITHYIFLNDIDNEETLKTYYPNFYQKLNAYKIRLEKRYQYNKQIPYWKWVFLRNFELFNSPKERIFVPCKERISNKNHFRFSYAEPEIFPTQDVTALFKKNNIKESIFYILAFLNNPRVFQWLIHNGIVKGNIVEFSERPIASIPFRKIDWNNPKEVEIHNKIVAFTKKYIEEKSIETLNNIHILFDQLFE